MPKVWKFEVNRLKQHELRYELASRGLSADVSVEGLRKLVRSALQLEAEKSLSEIKYSIEYETDVTAVNVSLGELRTFVDNFTGDSTTSEFLRFSTLWTHTIRRCKLMVATSTEQAANRNSLLLSLTDLHNTIDSMIKKHRHTTFGISQAVTSSPKLTVTEDEGEPDPLSSESDVEPEPTPVASCNYTLSQPAAILRSQQHVLYITNC
ncbi:hypothetical protein FQR65_LT03864 [Abscondita terminalis]|nr:hypothetical protein FQR65_LT03864 [Abscondita terminalis]